MAMTEEDYADAVRYLRRKGYNAKVDLAQGVIVAQDPVWRCGTGPDAGKLVPAPPKEVRLDGWRDVIDFLEERS